MCDMCKKCRKDCNWCEYGEEGCYGDANSCAKYMPITIETTCLIDELLSNIDIKRTGNVYIEQIQYEINKYREGV
jgi:hypothetical protein